MKNKKKHLTAISRKAPSIPMRWLSKQGLIVQPGLDFGCGRGRDAEEYGLQKYDPYYFPKRDRRRRFDGVYCIYVLNVLLLEEQDKILTEIYNSLSVKGTAYIAVRRGMKEGFTSRGTFQRDVRLPWDVLRETSDYAIYKKEKAAWH